MILSNRQIELLKHISEWGCDEVWCGGEKGNYEGTPCPFSWEGSQCIAYTNTGGDWEPIKRQARELLYQQEVRVMKDETKKEYIKRSDLINLGFKEELDTQVNDDYTVQGWANYTLAIDAKTELVCQAVVRNTDFWCLRCWQGEDTSYTSTRVPNICNVEQLKAFIECIQSLSRQKGGEQNAGN